MKPKSQNQTPEYFASITDPKKYVDACHEKIKQWRDYYKSKGLAGLHRDKLANYYGTSGDGAYSSQTAQSDGTEGELTNIKVNDLHKLVSDQVIIVTAARPAGIAKAINSDVRSLKNSRIASGLAEYYLIDKGYEDIFVKGCRTAVLIDEVYSDLFWDKDEGKEVRPEIDGKTGQILPKAVKEGDLKLRLHMPYNVARDSDLSVEKHRWHIISILDNRFDLAAKFPEFAEGILKAPQDGVEQLEIQDRDGEDNVYMHVVIHDRTPAVPNGRYSFIIGDMLVGDMKDEQGKHTLPYPDYPVDRMTPEDVIDGPTGYCPSNDVMAMEQVTDALHSTVVTNNIAFGTQNIVGPDLSGVKIVEAAKGMRYFQVPPEHTDKIKPLQLTQSAPETFGYIDKLSAKKEAMMGNVGGTLQAQAMQGASGSSMVLIQAQGVQANSGTQKSYLNWISRVMTKGIGVLRVYADTERVVRITGKSKARGLKEFKYSGKDLDSISSVVYEMVNPISQTVGGKLQMAQDLISNGQITNPRQYLTVAQTGELDALTEPDEDMNLLILEENEWLSEGKEVAVVVTENHAEHIRGHMSVLASPEAKSDAAIVEKVLAHIQDHMNQWQNASISNPMILLATGQQPLPPPQPMGMPGMPPGAPPSGAPAGSTGAPQAPNQQLEASQPSQPQMPQNPATGERAVVPGAQ